MEVLDANLNSGGYNFRGRFLEFLPYYFENCAAFAQGWTKDAIVIASDAYTSAHPANWGQVVDTLNNLYSQIPDMYWPGYQV